jgi:hypothetical protein
VLPPKKALRSPFSLPVLVRPVLALLLPPFDLLGAALGLGLLGLCGGHGDPPGWG